MPQASVVAMFKAVDVQDWNELRHYYAADCIYERPGFAAIEGLDALIHFYTTLRPIQSGRHILKEFIEQGERVCVAGHFEGALRSGVNIELQFMDMYLFDGQQIRYRQTFFFTPLA
jgi:ketosteroid isomerase-like protein